MEEAVSDVEMVSYIKSSDLEAIEAAAARDPGLIERGWRNGTQTWIMYAMRYDYEKVVPLLLSLGDDINAHESDRPDEDSINAALAGGRIDRLRFLLAHGAKPNKARVVWGAVTAGEYELEMVKLLEKHGADIHEVDEGGFSGRYANPLSLAIDYGLDDVVKYLKSRGCVMPPSDDEELLTVQSDSFQQSIIDHFVSIFGQPEKLTQIEIVPTGIPISIHAIPPSDEHPFVTLFTTGMSDHPMNVPEGAEEYSLAELYIQLPADWQYRKHDDPVWGWPQYWLRSMAQHQQENDTWLGGPVTLVANEDPPEPLAPHTGFTTLLLFADQSIATNDGGKIWLYRMTPLYTDERQLEIDEGVAALFDAFDAQDVSMIVDMNRKSVVSR